MERLEGFAFDDVVGMREAGIATEAVVRTGMIGFLEGCMFNGIFHGDLHGGNLLVLRDGRTGLLDFGITGRLPQDQRLAFLRLLVGASMNDVVGQLGALRDLGALPPDADLPAIVVELGLDKPPIDPTTLTAEELTGEIQRVLKALLGYGARLPKPLMLFVKNLVFLDGAITTLAPDLDLFAEITAIAMYFTTRHGERIANEVGLANDDWALDLSGVKAGFGVDTTEVDTLTHRDLRQRRQQIADRFEEQSTRRRPRRGRRDRRP
jgi:ubiquinone biosynthesis protein